ncbi:UPF0687 protein C20orf27 homolog [Cyanistes caeruleus]|uniref:UPF0687 protein C20orf27 homolog n=1 Tax=Cyanistes caeruleus TaxID=156563 RepID=UPI000CDB2788|nr:UPF0687 protein C20orf27 homolog [Cyanistes caeruleus]
MPIPGPGDAAGSSPPGSRPPRGHLGATKVPPLSPQWDGIGAFPFPSHSRRIPGRCPPAAEVGDSDRDGRRRGQMATAGKSSKAKGTGVRFAPEGTQGHPKEGTQGHHPQEGTHGHVHFQEQLHDSAVMVTQDKDGHFLVKGTNPSSPGFNGGMFRIQFLLSRWDS